VTRSPRSWLNAPRMEKLCYVLWQAPGRPGDATRDQLLGDVAPRLLAAGAVRLTVDVHDAHADFPPPLPAPPDETPIVALVSAWVGCHDFRAPLEEALAGTGCRVAGYLVTESLYTDYGDSPHGPPRDWPDGARSPGPLLVTFMEKPERLDDDAWYAHWYGRQSPMSAAIQPRTRYVRNAVARRLAPDAPPWRGIVEEAWPSIEHVLDPMRFYDGRGDQRRVQEHLAAMLSSVSAFLDLDRLRVVPMSEYLVRS